MYRKAKDMAEFDYKAFRRLLSTAVGTRTNIDFAHASGISAEHLSRMFNAPSDSLHRPTLKTLTKIAGASRGAVSLAELCNVCGYELPPVQSRIFPTTKEVEKTATDQVRSVIGDMFKDTGAYCKKAKANGLLNDTTLLAFTTSLMNWLISRYNKNVEITYRLDDEETAKDVNGYYFSYEPMEDGAKVAIIRVSLSAPELKTRSFESYIFIEYKGMDWLDDKSEPVYIGDDDMGRTQPYHEYDVSEKVRIFSVSCSKNFYGVDNYHHIFDADEKTRHFKKQTHIETALLLAKESGAKDIDKTAFYYNMLMLTGNSNEIPALEKVCKKQRPCSVDGLGFYYDNVSAELVKRFILRHKSAFVTSKEEEEVWEKVANGRFSTLAELRSALDGIASYYSSGADDNVGIAIANIIYRETNISVENWSDIPNEKGKKLYPEYENRSSVMICDAPIWQEKNETMSNLTEDTAQVILDEYASELGQRVGFTYFLMNVDDDWEN